MYVTNTKGGAQYPGVVFRVIVYRMDEICIINLSELNNFRINFRNSE